MTYDCDLCGSADAIEVPHAREYTGDQPIHICSGCGFVHVKERRSAREIAASWSDLYDGTYSAAIPAVVARLTYVAETIRQQIGMKGKTICDIGAGDGAFLEIARRMGAKPYGIEPSKAVQKLKYLRIPHFAGTAEEYARKRRFDIVTVNWTLENCSSCIDMLKAARRLLKPGGRLVVATGSRILVPFKKPLHCYLGKNPADTHAFRFSARTLQGALVLANFKPAWLNDYVASDVLCMIGEPSSGKGVWLPDEWSALLAGATFTVEGDTPPAVAAFFARWHEQWP